MKIAVIGAGLMGIKIAGEMVYHGHHVRLCDKNETTLNTAYNKLTEDREQLTKDGLLPTHSFTGNVLCLRELEEVVKDADFIFEAIVEDMTVKQELFTTISRFCRSDAILATNTMRLDLTEMFANTPAKERGLGVRFLYPVYYIPEVEISQSNYTSPLALEKVRLLLERMGKTLYFRRGTEPLVLTDAQREARKKVRQEQVKAASSFHFLHANTIPSLGQSSRSGSHEEEDGSGFHTPRTHEQHECAMCLEHPRNCVLCPCHHLVTCLQCAKQLLNRHDACPICRKPITDIMRIYES